MADTSVSSSKKYSGIVICVAFAIMFLVIDVMILPYIVGAVGNVIESVLRLVFFFVSLLVFMSFYDIKTVSDVLHFCGFGKGLLAGTAMLLYIPFVLITYYIVGSPIWLKPSISIVLGGLFLGQLAVALWEEVVFRGFVCEGYFLDENKTAGKRIMYALISGVIFGLVHAATAETLSYAILRFVLTGVFGVGFAAIYIYSHNILAAMFMHFITDVVMNSTLFFVQEWAPSNLMTILDEYVYFVVIGIIFIVAFIFLIKGDSSTSKVIADEKDE